MRLLSVDAATTGRDRAALATLIASTKADVACVHNSPHLLRWRSIGAALGRRSGLVVVGGGRPAGANLLLSSLGVDAPVSRNVDLVGGNALRRAGAVLGHLRVGGRDLVLVGATLIGNAADRLAQARRLQEQIASFLPADVVTVVCVEGAGRPGTAAFQALCAGRRAVAGRVFVDTRIGVADTTEPRGHAGAAIPPVLLDLAL